ncbi:superfamily I DNA/RNA helicase [Luteibacter sp. 621]|uniref:UvrD-helicase domain-containing protein n=1 Tax=Luteibacter sp. 621 TaxID=3373916 RepID=UPI003D1F143C
MIAPDEWTEAGGLVLEEPARDAVKLEVGSALITAGPGAGKTELLAQRADFLLATGLCPYPRRVLAISFKVDAARTLGDRVRRRSSADRASRFDSFTFHAFARRIIEIFRPLLKGKFALNPGFRLGLNRTGPNQAAFDDLVPSVLKLIEADPMVVRTVRMTYTHVFLDEFQDCTGDQYELVRALFGGTDIGLTAVGDMKQRIMGFAKALADVFTRFAADFDAGDIELFHNYRSLLRLRRIQNAMVADMSPRSVLPVAKLAGPGGEADTFELADCGVEAGTIADRIEQWLAEGVPGHEIAVLYRRRPGQLGQPVMAELDRRGIAWRNENEAADVASEPLSMLLVHFLRVLGDAPAPESFAALMGTLSGFDEEGKEGAWMRFVDDSRGVVAGAGPKARSKAVRRVVRALVSRCGQANIASLSADYSDPGYVGEVLDSVVEPIMALVDETGDLSVSLGRFASEGAVRLMTLHKCKGMEFEAVVMPATENEEWSWGESFEERRSLFFVGVSRAKSRLLVTAARHRQKPVGAANNWDVGRTPYPLFLNYVRTP